MEVRGAPLIGVAAAHGVALALADRPDSLEEACTTLAATRPTAVNLRWALDRVRDHLRDIAPDDRADEAWTFAERLADEDAAACRAIGDAGVDLLRAVHEETGRQVEILRGGKSKTLTLPVID